MFEPLQAAYFFACFLHLFFNHWSRFPLPRCGPLYLRRSRCVHFLFVKRKERKMPECKHPTCGETCRRPKKEKKVYQLKRTPLKKKAYTIKPVADKRKIQKQELKKLTEETIDPWTECEIKSPVPGVCTFFATLYHHTNGKENERLLIVEDLMKSCAGCNIWIETSEGTAWAYENGKKKYKHQIQSNNDH